MASLNALRQERHLVWIASGAELSVSDAADAPLPPEQLAALDATSPARGCTPIRLRWSRRCGVRKGHGGRLNAGQAAGHLRHTHSP